MRIEYLWVQPSKRFEMGTNIEITKHRQQQVGVSKSFGLPESTVVEHFLFTGSSKLF